MNSASKNKPVRVKEKVLHVQVFVRIRPLSVSEKSRGISVVHCNGNEVLVNDRQDHKLVKTFFCDGVFDQNSTQVEVFDHVLKPAIEDILKGFNYTVFAYGQSSSGKTYTIEGDRTPDQAIRWDNDPLCGLVPRALVHLLHELRSQQAEFTMDVTHLELCNEEMTDLLSRTGDSSKLRLYDDGSRKGAVCIHGLEEEVVHTWTDLCRALHKCLGQRVSSRSHSVFTITVHVKENSVDGDELVRTAKLCLVDLASSESAGRSAASDKGVREAGASNQSLLTLGRVITALVERAPHVPYRESKLTRLMRDALSGRSKSSIIGTVSPAASNFDETLATLEFVHRARNIVVRPEMNPKLTKESLIKEYMEEIDRLKRDLEACQTKQGVYMLNEDYTQMVADMARFDNEILEKLAMIRVLNEQADNKQRLCKELGVRLEDTQAHLSETRAQLRSLLWQRDETAHLLERHKLTEGQLAEQAGVVLRTVDEASADLRALHAKLERTRHVAHENENKRKELSEQFCRGMQETASQVDGFVRTFSERSSSFREDAGRVLNSDLPAISSMRRDLALIESSHGEGVAALSSMGDKMLTELTSLVDESAKAYADTAELDIIGQEYATNVVLSARELKDQLKLFCENFLDLYKHVKCKTLEETELTNKSLLERKEDVLCLREEFLGEMERRCTEKQRLCGLARDLQQRQKTSDMDLLAKMGEMRAALSCSASLGAEYREIIAGASELCQQEMEASADTDRRIIDDVNQKQASGMELMSQIKMRSEQLLSDVKQALDESEAKASEVRSGLATMTGDLEALAGAGAEAWSRRCNRVGADMSALGQRLGSCVLERDLAARRVCDATGERVRALVAQMSWLQQSVPARMGGLVERIDSQREFVSSWCSEMSDTFQRAAAEVSDLLEDHVEYKPTGSTPERKEYEYPKVLVATSPHDKVLEEFRLARKDLHSHLDFLNSSSEDGDTRSTQEAFEVGNALATSSPVETDSSFQSQSSVEAVCSSEPDLSRMDKENVPVTGALSVSKLPTRITHTNKDGVCKQILTPRN